MSETQHTPGKWTVHDQSLLPADGGLPGRTITIAAADCLFVQRAVNNHDNLVAALRRAVGHNESRGDYDWVGEAEKAIAAATE